MLKYLIQKEFLQMRRNSFMPKVIFVFPVIVMCVMPWVMNMEVKNVVVDIVDNDRSAASRRLVERVGACSYLVSGGLKSSYAEAMEDIGRCRADIILEIPPHYGRSLARGQVPQVLIAANAVNGTKGSIGATYLSQVVAAEQSETLRKSVSLPMTAGMATASVQASTLFLYNPQQDYKVFMVPALMGILLMMLCGFLPALNIVGEKEAGTIEQINVTPVSKSSFILAKLIPYWLIALVVLSLCFVLSWILYGIGCRGPLWLVYVLSVFLALFFSSFGLIVSNYSDTMQQAMLVMWFFVVCLMLLSGLFTPVRSMPHWAYLTTYANPMHYYIDAMRTVFVRGGGLAEVASQLGALAAFAFVMGGWAVSSYRKNS